jgi:hypothetical protein
MPSHPRVICPKISESNYPIQGSMKGICAICQVGIWIAPSTYHTTGFGRDGVVCRDCAEKNPFEENKS